MTDDELERLYKSMIELSHFAGLRAVWDNGYQAGGGGYKSQDSTPLLREEVLEAIILS